jgi:hypothetical protein
MKEYGEKREEVELSRNDSWGEEEKRMCLGSCDKRGMPVVPSEKR